MRYREVSRFENKFYKRTKKTDDIVPRLAVDSIDIEEDGISQNYEESENVMDDVSPGPSGISETQMPQSDDIQIFDVILSPTSSASSGPNGKTEKNTKKRKRIVTSDSVLEKASGALNNLTSLCNIRSGDIKQKSSDEVFGDFVASKLPEITNSDIKNEIELEITRLLYAGVRFFRIPSIYGPNRKINELAQRRRQMWINAIKRADLTETKIKYGRVCSKHFLTGKPSSLNDENNPDWVPSKGMGYTTIAISMQSKGLERYKRKKRAERILESTSIEPPEDLNQAIDVEEPGEVTIEDLQFALQKANTEIYSLTAEMNAMDIETTQKLASVRMHVERD
ncbi:hypothetical protein NQ314_000981, partial [Rhamnusium bicolor]